jgi:hypothetical protein
MTAALVDLFRLSRQVDGTPLFRSFVSQGLLVRMGLGVVQVAGMGWGSADTRAAVDQALQLLSPQRSLRTAMLGERALGNSQFLDLEREAEGSWVQLALLRRDRAWYLSTFGEAIERANEDVWRSFEVRAPSLKSLHIVSLLLLPDFDRFTTFGFETEAGVALARLALAAPDGASFVASAGRSVDPFTGQPFLVVRDAEGRTVVASHRGWSDDPDRAPLYGGPSVVRWWVD